jgi:hypothetical protein
VLGYKRLGWETILNTMFGAGDKQETGTWSAKEKFYITEEGHLTHWPEVWRLEPGKASQRRV